MGRANVNNLSPKIIYPSLRNKVQIKYSYYNQPKYLVLITYLMSLNLYILYCIGSRQTKINKEVRIKTILKVEVSALQIIRQIFGALF